MLAGNQLPRLALVVVGTPVLHRSQRHEAATQNNGRDLDPLAPLSTSAGLKVRAGRRRLQTSGVHGSSTAAQKRFTRRLTDGANNRVGDFQDLATRAELLERGVERQLFIQSQFLAQTRADESNSSTPR